MELIKKARVTRLALCKRGKNRLRTLLKSSETFGRSVLSKAIVPDNQSELQGELLVVIAAPELEDEDGQGFTRDACKDMAYSYAQGEQEFDIEHDGKVLAKDQVFLAENFIVQPGDQRFKDWQKTDGSPAGDLTGAWAGIVKLLDQNLLDAFDKEDWDGISLFGEYAAPEQAELQTAAKSSTKENMDPETQKALLEAIQGLGAKLDKLAETAQEKAPEPAPEPAAPKPEEPKADPEAEQAKRPTFKGDPSKPEDLEAFAQELRAFEALQALSSKDLSVEKVLEMAKSASAPEPEEETGNQYFAMQKASNVAAQEPNRDKGSADMLSMESINRIADLMNGRTPKEGK